MEVADLFAVFVEVFEAEGPETSFLRLAFLAFLELEGSDNPVKKFSKSVFFESGADRVRDWLSLLSEIFSDSFDRCFDLCFFTLEGSSDFVCCDRVSFSSLSDFCCTFFGILNVKEENVLGAIWSRLINAFADSKTFGP